MNDLAEDIATADTRPGLNRKRIGRFLAIGWTLLVACYFLWEANGYQGFFGILSEWQYSRFNQALPLFTFTVLAAIVALPAWLLYWLLVVRRQPKQPTVDPALDKWMTSANRFRRILYMVAGIFGAFALATLLWGLFLPGTTKPVRLIAPDGSTVAQAGSNPDAGMIVGAVDTRLTSTMAQDLLFMRRNVQFAPVIEPARPDVIRYFVELNTDDPLGEADSIAARERVTSMSIERMPGAILTLYRNLGYRVAEPHYLLSASQHTLRWPYLVSAGQLAIVALVALLIGLLQQRRIRRIESRTRIQPTATV